MLCLWLIFLHLCLVQMNLLTQFSILTIPFLFTESHRVYRESKMFSFLLAVLGFMPVLTLTGLTVIAFIGD